MKISNSEKRLEQFWGKVDKKHISYIENFLVGKNVLDMGCGYGTTTSRLTSLNYNCIGIDNDAAAINAARKRFPESTFQLADAESMPFEDSYFDTVVLRDALHHFYGEADFKRVKSEISRVSKSKARIIFFDPNVNFILKTMRKISFHQDEECNFETALEIMKSFDAKIIYSAFNTVYSLPLSGGYVGLNFIPNIDFLHSIILKSERKLERIINKIHCGRYLCWRYMIVGQR